MDLARAPRRAPLTARKKGSGYENGKGPIYVLHMVVNPVVNLTNVDLWRLHKTFNSIYLPPNTKLLLCI